jgi:hypothetical protein
LAANSERVVPPATAIASVELCVPPAKLMTWVRTLKLLPPIVIPVLKRLPAAVTALPLHVSSPSVTRMKLTLRHGRSRVSSGVARG